MWQPEIRNNLGPSYPNSPLSSNIFSSASSRIDGFWSCKYVTFQLSLALLWSCRVRVGLCVQKSGQNVLCVWHKRILFWTYCKTSLNKFLVVISSVFQYHAVSIAALNLWIRPPDGSVSRTKRMYTFPSYRKAGYYQALSEQHKAKATYSPGFSHRILSCSKMCFIRLGEANYLDLSLCLFRLQQNTMASPCNS